MLLIKKEKTILAQILKNYRIELIYSEKAQ